MPEIRISIRHHFNRMYAVGLESPSISLDRKGEGFEAARETGNSAKIPLEPDWYSKAYTR
jgi:hypothetical protein